MNKIIFLIILLALNFIIISCDDDPVKADLKTQAGKITVLDKISGKPLDGYRVDIFQTTGTNDDYKTQKKFSISPNPFSSYLSFFAYFDNPSNIDFSIINLLTKKSFHIYTGDIKKGTFGFVINLADSLHIEIGMYKAILKINGVNTDSTNFIYYSKNNPLLTKDRKLYYLNSFISDSSGKITMPDYLPNLINEDFTITAENGQLLSTFKLTNHFKIFVYDRDFNIVFETYTTFEILRDVGLILKV
ncbi:MAG: hypothetical protein KIT33_09500 [Candidatus Kapabacteria bacterium]|nr:hypothetical protein [Ignavibacteriota bacterium]MCW5885192.1 hypothetical protein [Candidatus Kapabacteria bacterium]